MSDHDKTMLAIAQERIKVLSGPIEIQAKRLEMKEAIIGSLETRLRLASTTVEQLEEAIEKLRKKSNALLGEIVALEVAIDLRDRPSRN